MLKSKKLWTLIGAIVTALAAFFLAGCRMAANDIRFERDVVIQVFVDKQPDNAADALAMNDLNILSGQAATVNADKATEIDADAAANVTGTGGEATNAPDPD